MYFLDRKLIDELGDTQSDLRQGFQEMLAGGPGEEVASKGFMPPVDVVLGKDQLAITMELAGVSRRDVQLGLVGDELVIQGKRKSPVEQSVERYYKMELHYGEFERRIRLPGGIDTDDIDANYSDGFLVIRIARSPGAEVSVNLGEDN